MVGGRAKAMLASTTVEAATTMEMVTTTTFAIVVAQVATKDKVANPSVAEVVTCQNSTCLGIPLEGE